ncbi:MAG: hypothetical protein COB07_02620 [Sulfurovum sp.]|nr:MAG: hypothetical protein COB07_07385 [Sulfurovum sp.]PHS41384.1 MAG: hypothetical protein COB07_02620 [Sulfurovum sp.]
MQKIFLGLILLLGMYLGLHAEVSMHATPIPEQPIVRPPIDPERPIRPRPIIRPALLSGRHYHNYYDTVSDSNCDDYIEMLKEKDEKIAALLEENARLKEEAQTGLQKRLKEEYDKELKKFDNRHKSKHE